MTEGNLLYTGHRETCIQWTGRLPAHWDIKRGKALFRRVRRQVRPEDEVVTCFRDGTVTLRKNRRSRGFTESIKEIGYQGIRKGDLVIHAMDAFAGAIGVSDADGKGSPVYAVCTPMGAFEPLYYAHLLREMARNGWILSLAKGIRERSTDFRFDDFASQFFPVPPPDEQAAIVRFLDHAERRIRRYIRAKRQLISLLNEQKQAIIHQAVTRGLDPNVRLKPSGVEWLGDVPEHWQRTALKNVALVHTGVTMGKRYGQIPLEVRPYLRVANVQAGFLNLQTVKTVEVPQSEIAGSELQPGDVLMTEGGDIDKLGRGCVWRGEIEGCLHQNHVFAVRPNQDRLLPDFLVLLMASRHGRCYFEITAKRTTNLASTNSTTLGAFPLYLPDVQEQSQILESAALETSSMDTAINRAEREIVLLGEYRFRLVADVVTGKLDVREVSARLPEEVEDGYVDIEDIPESDADADELHNELEEVES